MRLCCLALLLWLLLFAVASAVKAKPAKIVVKAFPRAVQWQIIICFSQQQNQ